MGKVTGFMEFERLEQEHEPTAQRKSHYREFIKPLNHKDAKIQAARCMDCGTPFCTFSCPLHNIAPEFNDLIYQGDWEGAYEVLSQTNNFPEFTSRVCPALCENGCVMNFTDKAMGVKSIERAVITNAFNQGWVQPQMPKTRTGKSVAIIGSGPAGLACAQQLARKGHSVTVFEKSSKAGGLLRFGIPDFKLDKSLIDRRISQMEAEGVQFRCNIFIGSKESAPGVINEAERTLSPNEILRDFDAVVLAIGSEEPRNLPIEGRNLDGIHFAVEYLSLQNKQIAGIPAKKSIDAKGKKVLIIGGGDTGSDCLGTAIRQGAAKVLQIDLAPKLPETYDKLKVWPDWPRINRTSTSQEEGGERDWGIMSRKFNDDGNGRVKTVSAVRVTMEKDPLTGRFAPVPVKDSEFEIEADLVLLAMGFIHPNEKVLEAFKVKKTKFGTIQADTEGADPFRTSVKKVFAAGDCRKGQSLVVHALSEGRSCAEAVHDFLTKG